MPNKYNGQCRIKKSRIIMVILFFPGGRKSCHDGMTLQFIAISTFRRRKFRKVWMRGTISLAPRSVLPVRKQTNEFVTQQMSLLGQSETKTQKRPV
jgi:hypothetical protein